MQNQVLTTQTSPHKKYIFTNKSKAARFRVRLYANCITFSHRVRGESSIFHCSHRLSDCEEHYNSVMEESNA